MVDLCAIAHGNALATPKEGADCAPVRGKHQLERNEGFWPLRDRASTCGGLDLVAAPFCAASYFARGEALHATVPEVSARDAATQEGLPPRRALTAAASPPFTLPALRASRFGTDAMTLELKRAPAASSRASHSPHSTRCSWPLDARGT